MASKSAYHESEKGAEIEELLDELDKLLERLRAMYEQYFLGIAKVAPTTLHTEAERRIRDLTQVQIKNTGLRYRFATLGQKFGAYNTYWKRTMRMIESGKYVRDLERVKRQAAKTGEAIPEEILAAMPKMMRERVQRDRAQQVKIADRRAGDDAEPAVARAPRSNMHRLDESMMTDDIDVESMFASLTKEAEDAINAAPIVVSSKPPKPDEEPPPPPLNGISAVDVKLNRPLPPTTPRRSGTSSDHRTEGAITRGGGARPPPTPVPPRPAAPPTRAGGTAAPRPLTPPPGMNDDQTRQLYQKYLKARELCGESNDGVTYDKLVRTLRSQSSKIMTDGRVKGVEFGVVIKDNKVVLKAKPKT